MKEISSEEQDIINKIAARAIENHHFGSNMDIIMDVTCVHKNTGLRLDDMLKARHLDFFHDIFGIMLYLNRRTGAFENCFSPRFSC